jgi:RNA polymerase sigma-70 factor (ECF subfamily)
VSTGVQAGDGDAGEAIETDEDLLVQIGVGHRGAVAELYRRHGPSLLALLTRAFDDHQLAEEALQDTFLAVWRGASFNGRSRVRTWLVGIAVRQAGSQRRKKRFPIAEAPEDSASSDLGPEDATILSLDAFRITAALARLSEFQREVLLLAFVEQLTQSEMAEVLEVRIGTVKSRMHSAKRALERQWHLDNLQ